MFKKGRVLMAMSGGIDSSVAAIMLHDEGYEVIGMTMKTWDYANTGSSKKETGCCSLDSINDARQIAVNLGFPHYVVDIRNEFDELIIKDFVSEYLKGRTPNPCVLCNTHIKWEALLKRADSLGCDFIATGHYAQVREENGRFVISKGLDESKDQSYVLWGLTQSSLSRTLFPLGKFHKDEIKKMAADLGYFELAEKKESYEICFIPDDDYRSFLKYKLPEIEEKYNNGDFISTDGKVLGKHKGFPFYTIGQRKGLEIAVGEPLYVNKIVPETNTIVLGNKADLMSKEMVVSKCNYVKYAQIPDGKELMAKVRYKDKGTKCKVFNVNGNLKIEFSELVSAITPGQSAVIYENNDLVAGGFIE